MTPFDYPHRPLGRRHGPMGYRSVAGYRPWLRDEFDFRCVYCLRRETWEPKSSLFEIDHIRPASRYPELFLTYSNLVYACSICNLGKRDVEIEDPLSVFVEGAIEVQRDGRLATHTLAAKRLVLQLDLNDPNFVSWRAMTIAIHELAARFDPALLAELLAPPDDLPDLAALRPPGGNSRPDGAARSHFARRVRP